MIRARLSGAGKVRGHVGTRGTGASPAGGGVSFSTWDAANKGAAISLSGGNLIATASAGDNKVTGTRGRLVGSDSLTYQFEVIYTLVSGSPQQAIGLAPTGSPLTNAPGDDANSSWGYSNPSGVIRYNATLQTVAASYATGTAIQVTLNLSTGVIKFYKAGVLQYTTSAVSGTWYPTWGHSTATSGSASGTLNTGATAFANTIAGAIAWG